MKRSVKKLYAEMLLNSIINHDWTINKKEVFSVWDNYFVNQYDSYSHKAGKYSYSFQYKAKKSKYTFSKEVRVLIQEERLQTDTLKFNIFSKIYWRLLQMEKDYKNNTSSKITNFYVDVYKAYKQDINKKSLKELEQSLRNLEELEAQHKQKIAEYEKEKV